MKSIDAFIKTYPKYDEFMGDQIAELDDFVIFEDGFDAGREYYDGQVIQVSSDTWYRYNGKTWSEMSVEEQVAWSARN